MSCGNAFPPTLHSSTPPLCARLSVTSCIQRETCAVLAEFSPTQRYCKPAPIPSPLVRRPQAVKYYCVRAHRGLFGLHTTAKKKSRCPSRSRVLLSRKYHHTKTNKITTASLLNLLPRASLNSLFPTKAYIIASDCLLPCSLIIRPSSPPAMLEVHKIESHIKLLLAHFAFLAPLVWLLSLISALLAPAKIALDQHKSQAESVHTPSLFPSISNVSIESDEEEEASRAHPIPCSTGITTRLLPFKNSKGEIEWAFTEDLPPGLELEAFRIHHEPSTVKKEDNILSPVTSSSSSNNESVVYDKQSVAQVNTPLSTALDDDKTSGKEDEGAGESADDQLHQCPHCNTLFKMRGYLTRHMKKHASEKAYKCPFHKSSIYKDDNDVVHKCHPTGGFSRRDTYKTHLKSRHFKYPENTPIKARNSSAGNCSMCGEWFENGEVWCEIHIEGGECKYLPPGFKGKSRIKNRLKKELAKMMREQRRTKQRKTKLPVQNTQSPIMGTPNSMTTPMPPTASSCEYNDSPSSTLSHLMQHPGQHKHELPAVEMVPQGITLGDVPALSPDDYDDGFCLDTEQLSVPIPTPEMLLQQSMVPSMPMSSQLMPQQFPPQMSQQMPQQMPQQVFEQQQPQKFYQQQIPAHIRTQMQMQMPMGFHGDETMIREKGY